MLHPTAIELSENKEKKEQPFNRYEVALATAKTARDLTDQYVEQREKAEETIAASKDTDRPVNTLIDADLRDEKAVQLAVKKLKDGKYVIVRKEDEKEESAQ